MFQSMDHIQGLLREYYYYFDLERTVYQLALRFHQNCRI